MSAGGAARLLAGSLTQAAGPLVLPDVKGNTVLGRCSSGSWSSWC